LSLLATFGPARQLSPVGFRLIDELTLALPLGRIAVVLDVSDGKGGWIETDIEASETAGGIFIYPGLGRVLDPRSAPTVRYRARVVAELYFPVYPPFSEGIEFDVPPWSDAVPPSPVPILLGDVFLLPAFEYPFPSHVPVIRGQVVLLSDGTPVAGAAVTYKVNVERTLTDERGQFSLPMRFGPSSGTVAIDAATLTMTGTSSVTLPGGNDYGITIPIK
jgi:hypothetical protein